MTELPPEALLANLPDPMPELAAALRRLVLAAVPEAIERVRPGWGVIGYDVPRPRQSPAYFAWVMPQHEHVHLGFPKGVLLGDPERRLSGAGEAKLARWLTLVRAEDLDPEAFAGLLREAAAIARTPGSAAFARVVAGQTDRR